MAQNFTIELLWNIALHCGKLNFYEALEKFTMQLVIANHHVSLKFSYFIIPTLHTMIVSPESTVLQFLKYTLIHRYNDNNDGNSDDEKYDYDDKDDVYDDDDFH